MYEPLMMTKPGYLLRTGGGGFLGRGRRTKNAGRNVIERMCKLL